MKNIYLTLAVALLVFINLYAQDDQSVSSEPRFGMKAGYSTTILKVTVDGTSASDDIAGFYIGVFGEFEISEKINVQPEINYGNYSDSGESTGVLLVPVLLKFKPSPELGLLVGPQLDYLLNEKDSEGLKRIGLGVALGSSYDITENVIIEARYAFGLSNRLDGNLQDFEEYNVKVKFNYFQIGLGYKF